MLPPNTPKTLPPFEANKSIFNVIDKDDVLLLHPYESFDPVTKFIQNASKDPKVLSIRMTLYRVEKNSPIIQALIDAANNGIQVTVMVELKARFDEENNLRVSQEDDFDYLEDIVILDEAIEQSDRFMREVD